MGYFGSYQLRNLKIVISLVMIYQKRQLIKNQLSDIIIDMVQ